MAVPSDAAYVVLVLLVIVAAPFYYSGFHNRTADPRWIAFCRIAVYSLAITASSALIMLVQTWHAHWQFEQVISVYPGSSLSSTASPERNPEAKVWLYVTPDSEAKVSAFYDDPKNLSNWRFIGIDDIAGARHYQHGSSSLEIFMRRYEFDKKTTIRYKLTRSEIERD